MESYRVLAGVKGRLPDLGDEGQRCRSGIECSRSSPSNVPSNHRHPCSLLLFFKLSLVLLRRRGLLKSIVYCSVYYFSLSAPFSMPVVHMHTSNAPQPCLRPKARPAGVALPRGTPVQSFHCALASRLGIIEIRLIVLLQTNVH